VNAELKKKWKEAAIALSWHMAAKTEENHGKPQSG
jgi:hypothetical protein